MTSYYPAKEIVPGLWVGSQGDSENPKFMRSRRVGLVVNASRNIPMSFGQTIQSYRIPVDDDPSMNDTMLRHWPLVVPQIDDVLASGKAVLVHCRAGMQRSAATAAAYVMWKCGLTAQRAMAYLQSRKAETFYPVATFERALQAWEKRLRADGRISAAGGGGRVCGWTRRR